MEESEEVVAGNDCNEFCKDSVPERQEHTENIRRISVCCGGPKTVEHDSTKT